LDDELLERPVLELDELLELEELEELLEDDELIDKRPEFEELLDDELLELNWRPELEELDVLLELEELLDELFKMLASAKPLDEELFDGCIAAGESTTGATDVLVLGLLDSPPLPHATNPRKTGSIKKYFIYDLQPQQNNKPTEPTSEWFSVSL
jgi:hypothetical protein